MRGYGLKDFIQLHEPKGKIKYFIQPYTGKRKTPKGRKKRRQLPMNLPRQLMDRTLRIRGHI